MATYRVSDEDGDYYETDGDPADRIEQLTAERDDLRDLLGSIWLYVNWRYVTRQLTTEQKELWADAVDADVMKGQIEDGEEPRPVAERWWRNDFVEDDDD